MICLRACKPRWEEYITHMVHHSIDVGCDLVSMIDIDKVPALPVVCTVGVNLDDGRQISLFSSKSSLQRC